MHKLLLSALLIALVPMSALRAEDEIKPLDLSFTAVDGKTVDFAKLRGKVVLIDFWATWCPPCRASVPDVVAAYTKYHDKGFEVVGVSLDEDKATMQNFTERHGMVWPQYFDGLKWDNKISSSFGVQEIPAMILLGRDGRPVHSEAASLDEAVQKALDASTK